jgi:hypothetical protein
MPRRRNASRGQIATALDRRGQLTGAEIELLLSQRT